MTGISSNSASSTRARWRSTIVIAGLLVSLIGPFAPSTGRAAPGTVLVIVGNSGSPASFDTAVIDRLTANGHQVIVMDDGAAQAADTVGADLVLISSSVGSGPLGSRLSGIPVPVMVAKPWSLDDFGLTGPATSNYGNKNVTSIVIVEPGHPSAAGYTGSVQLSAGNTRVSWGTPPPSAVVVASADGDPTIYHIGQGELLADGDPAPGCRLTFPLFKAAVNGYNANAWALFDASIDWGTGNCGATPGDSPPEVSLTDPAPGSTVSGAVQLTAQADDDNGVTQVRFAVDGVIIADDIDPGDGWSISWDSTNGADGTRELTAMATDTVGQVTTSAPLTVTVDNITDDDPPTVTITAPADGAAVSGSVAISADAFDDHGVASVRFFVGASSIGVDDDSTDGWAIAWDSTAVPDGAGTISATATDTVGQTTDSEPVAITVDNLPGGDILYVVGSPGNITAGDSAVHDRLVDGGNEITIVDDAAVQAEDAAGQALVIVSSSVSPSTLGSRLEGVATPVLVANPWSFDDFGMTNSGGSNYGSRSGSSVTIVDSSHPTAGGFDGQVALSAGEIYMSWGNPPPSAQVVATADGDAVIFNIEAGQPLADNDPTPACRLHFPIYKNSPSKFTNSGWALFDATIQWGLRNCSGQPVDRPPDISITGPAHGQSVAGLVDIDAAATDDQGVVEVEFLVNGVLVGTDANGGDGWDVKWDTTSVADGSATISATATDTVGQTTQSAAVVVTVDNDMGPNPPIGDEAEQVILIFVDGLKPAAVESLGPEGTPSLHRMIGEGATTLNARTVYEQTRTMPDSTSMFTGYPVDLPDGHGVDFNVDDGGTVHDAAGRYIPSIFDVVHDAGGRTVYLESKPKMDFFDRSWDETTGAVDVVGPDDGRDKIDFYSRVASGDENTAALIGRLDPEDPGVLVIHYREPDLTGHESGFDSAEYLDAVVEVDSLIGLILEAIADDPALSTTTTVVLTSDHGGDIFDHADASLPQNYTIPFMVWGAGVTTGDLYVMNPVTRSDPGVGRPNYSEPDPVRNADAANLIADLLGLPSVAGSSINDDQSLAFSVVQP